MTQFFAWAAFGKSIPLSIIEIHTIHLNKLRLCRTGYSFAKWTETDQAYGGGWSSTGPGPGRRDKYPSSSRASISIPFDLVFSKSYKLFGIIDSCFWLLFCLRSTMNTPTPARSPNIGAQSLHTAWLFQGLASFPTAITLGVYVFDNLFSPYYLNIYRFITYTFNTVSLLPFLRTCCPNFGTALRVSNHIHSSCAMEFRSARWHYPTAEIHAGVRKSDHSNRHVDLASVGQHLLPPAILLRQPRQAHRSFSGQCHPCPGPLLSDGHLCGPCTERSCTRRSGVCRSARKKRSSRG